MSQIDFKQMKEFIKEALSWNKDILCFYKHGNLYFNMIENERWDKNLYRLSTYIVLALIVKAVVFSPKINVNTNLTPNFGWLFYQLPLVSVGYVIAILFSKTNKKFKLCINYIVFQNTITILLPFSFLACFVVSEAYFFYYLYVVTLICFIIFLLIKFAVLFFSTRFMQICSIAIILVSNYCVAAIISKIDTIDLVYKNAIIAFEDPIASEFFALNCFEEAKIINKSTNFDDVKKFHEAAQKFHDSLDKDTLPDKIVALLEMEKIKTMMHDWNLSLLHNSNSVEKRQRFGTPLLFPCQ